MPAFDNLHHKSRTYGIDKMGGKNPAGKKIDRVYLTGFLVPISHIFVIKILPEICSVDSPVFDVRQGGFNGINVMNREKTWNAHLPCHGGN